MSEAAKTDRYCPNAATCTIIACRAKGSCAFPSQMVDRHEQERDEFMGAHAAGIVEYWNHCSDPTSYSGWDEEKVRQYWPEFWELWRRYVQARQAIHRHVENVMERRAT